MRCIQATWKKYYNISYKESNFTRIIGMETNINRAAEPTCDGAPLHPSLSHFSQTSA